MRGIEPLSRNKVKATLQVYLIFYVQPMTIKLTKHHKLKSRKIWQITETMTCYNLMNDTRT